MNHSEQPTQGSGAMGLSPELQAVIEAAIQGALTHETPVLRPDHILMALLEESAWSEHLLQDLKVNVIELKRDLANFTEQQDTKTENSSQSPSNRKNNGTTANMGRIPSMNGAAQRLFAVAGQDAKYQNEQELYPKHILFALAGEDTWFRSYLEKYRVNKKTLIEHSQQFNTRGETTQKMEQKKFIDKYTQNLTNLAREEKLEPIIGKLEETRRLMEILSRKMKNNPILIGQAGVGKTAIVEGLARRIVKSDVPLSLKGTTLLSLDLGSVMAGSQFRGQFEERLKKIMHYVEASKGKIILFIDEIHTLMGAGKLDGALDAANLLKPALGRGSIRLIGATTIDEYKKYIEKDPAFERRLQSVYVAESTPTETLSILRGLRDRYELHHKVEITDEAMEAAVTLSERYINDRYLPDKAIDLLDEAAAKVKVDLESMPEEIDVLERDYERLTIEIKGLSKKPGSNFFKKIVGANKNTLEPAADRDIDNNTSKNTAKNIDKNVDKDTIETDLWLRSAAGPATTEARNRAKLNDLKANQNAIGEKLQKLKKDWLASKKYYDDVSTAKKQLDELKNKETRLVREGRLDQVAEIRYSTRPALEKKLTELELLLKKAISQGNTRHIVNHVVERSHIQHVVSRWTGIPISDLKADEKSQLLTMEKKLAETIVDQNHVLKAIGNAIRRSKLGLSASQRPIGSFLFLGSTGVGKTFTAECLAEYLFHDKKRLIRLDMSEYMELHSIAKIIGAPPGYVGYDQGKTVCDTVREHPYSVILFDEIEKAHSEVLNILLQILDNGSLVTSSGKKVNFTNTVVILTSNLISHLDSHLGRHVNASTINGDNNSKPLQPNLLQQNLQQYGQAGKDSEKKYREVQKLLRQHLKSHLKPELIGRIDEVILFNRLTIANIGKILEIELAEFAARLRERGIQLVVRDAVKELVSSEGFEDISGARGLRHAFNEHIVSPVANFLLTLPETKPCQLLIDLKEHGTISIEHVFTDDAPHEATADANLVATPR
ncbi:chaperone protein ClpB [Spirochaetota bacterium]|nr:chaperone protein ClpB [Spirochaetota bacterium]